MAQERSDPVSRGSDRGSERAHDYPRQDSLPSWTHRHLTPAAVETRDAVVALDGLFALAAFAGAVAFRPVVDQSLDERRCHRLGCSPGQGNNKKKRTLFFSIFYFICRLSFYTS